MSIGGATEIATTLNQRLIELQSQLKNQYKNANKQVTSNDLRKEFRDVCEMWLVDLASREEVKASVDDEVFASLSTDFETLHQSTQHATLRKIYDKTIRGIVKRFQLDVIVAIKKNIATPQKQSASQLIRPSTTIPTIFVGHSFLPQDAEVCEPIIGLLRAIGFQVFTGEKPKAERISEKVKELIDSQDIFVGIFTKRDKIAKKNEWTTTTWVVEEKTWAMAKGKRLILLRESGVFNIGGMHADHEYIEIDRKNVGQCFVKIVELFNVRPVGLR